MGFPAETACIVVGGWLVAALVLGLVRQDRGAKSNNASEIAYCQPLTGRLGMLMFAIWCVAAFPLMYASGIFGSGSAMTSESWFLFGLLEIMCMAISLLIYYASGPNDLFLNLDEHTYRLVHGWPHSPKAQTGPLSEIAGVFVCCRQMNMDYMVGLVWKNDWKSGRKWFVILGRFNRSGQADRLAQETAAVLGLPLVSPPSSLKSSSDVRNGLS